MAPPKKSGGFQGFIDPNGNRLDFFQQLDQIKNSKKQPQNSRSVHGVSGYSGTTGTKGISGVTGFTTNVAETIYTPPKESNKVRNKIKFDIEKIN